MYIARQKRQENIAEYLIYMWQIEDIIRANGLDIDRIKKNVIDRYQLSPDAEKEMIDWYQSLIDMMRDENVQEHGHLQINRNVMIRLVELHQALLKDPRFPEYTAQFYKALPFIVELRAKAGEAAVGELETCFTALYGMLMLRLRSREVSPETENAMKQISTFIAMLARHYHAGDVEEKE